jgi:protein-tyrosine phosphatase
MTDGDRALLENAGIKTIVDFRGSNEQVKAPDENLKTVVKTWGLTIDAGNLVDFSKVDRGLDGEILMQELYRVMVVQAVPQYRRFFGILADAQNAPLLFHCSAGKDRTGLAAALILCALGVEIQYVHSDYMLSASCLGDKYHDLVAGEPHTAPLMTVKQSYLDAALAYMDECYGGIAGYLENELGAGRDVLRELYTEPAP